MPISRIAVVHSFYGPGPSGENIAVENQIALLRAAGYEVELFSKYSEVERKKALFSARAGSRVATGFGQNPLEPIDRFKPDVVHIHNLFPNWGSDWIKNCRWPMVATLHNYRLICGAGTLLRDGKDCTLCPRHGSHNIIRFRCFRSSAAASIPLALATRHPERHPLIRHTRAFIFLSNFSRRQFQKFLPGLTEKNHPVIPNFVPTPKGVETPSKHNSDSWLFAGRLSPEKGLVELIDAWPDNRPLQIAGDGPLRDKVQEKIVGRNMTFLGQLPHTAMARLLSESRGVIIPSVWSELSPLIFLEAISLGKPLVAIRGSQPARDIERFDCGAVVESFSQLDRALEQIDSRYQVLAANCLRAHREHFSEGPWLQKLEAVYSQAIAV